MADNKKSMADVVGMSAIRPQPSGSSRVNVGTTERILSAAGGALLTTVGLRRGGVGGSVLALLGGALVFRGASGYCPVNKALGRDAVNRPTEPLEITRSVTINKPRADVYQYWRQLENLPKFMQHLESVMQIDSKRSHWVAQVQDNPVAKAVGTIEWDAEIIEEEENSRLVWRSVPGASWDNAGEVRFVDAPNDRGTTVQVTIRYAPPAGELGSAVAKLLQPAFRQLVKDDIARFKRLLETGSYPMTNTDPVVRRMATGEPALHGSGVL